MKTLNINVEITFSDNLGTDTEVKEVANNIKNALVDKVKRYEVGIAPDNSDIYTEKILVFVDMPNYLTEYSF